MHFKASCSYAAIAAIMETYGVDTEDYKIALDIKLPWMFAREDGEYRSGPMLQGGKWFNLWLKPPASTPLCSRSTAENTASSTRPTMVPHYPLSNKAGDFFDSKIRMN